MVHFMNLSESLPVSRGASVLHGATILDAMVQAKITHVVSVPDLTTSEGVLRPLATHPGLSLVRICREEEGVGICSGMHSAGARAVMLVQYTGFLASMNAVRAIAIEYRQPICMVIGLLYVDSPGNPSGSKNYGVSKMVPLLKTLGLKYLLVSCDEDAALIADAISSAFETSEPLVVLISRHPLA